MAGKGVHTREEFYNKVAGERICEQCQETAITQAGLLCPGTCAALPLTPPVTPNHRCLAGGRGVGGCAAARQRAPDLRGRHPNRGVRDHGPQSLHPVGRRH